MKPKKFLITATGLCSLTDKEITVTEKFEEWWFEGKLVEPIEDTAEDYFYTATFDKGPFKIINIKECR